MNFRQWHLHILASTAILATSLSFDAVAQTSGSKAHPVASLEKNTNIQHHEPQSTASDFSVILQEDTWLDANTKTLLGEFLHIGAVEEFHNLFVSEKFNALDSTAKRQVINAVSEFAREHHIEKSARMATSEAMTRILQGEVLSGKVFSEPNSPSVEQEVGSSIQAPAYSVNTGNPNVQAPVDGTSQAKPVTPVQSPYSALTQTPASRSMAPSSTTGSSHPTVTTSPVPSFGGGAISSPVTPVGVVSPVTTTSGGGTSGVSPVTTTTSGGGTSGVSPVTTTTSGGGTSGVSPVTTPTGSGTSGVSPVTTTTSGGVGGGAASGGSSGGGSPVTTTTGGGTSGGSPVTTTTTSGGVGSSGGSPVTTASGGSTSGGSPVTTTTVGGGGSSGGSPVTTTTSGGGTSGVSPVTTTTGGGTSGVSPVTTASGGGTSGVSPVTTTTGGGTSGVSPVLSIEKSKTLEEVLMSNGVTDKPAQILKDVFDNTKTSYNPFKKGGENYRFSEPYDELSTPVNQARIAALTSDERKQLANAVEALKTKALADPKSPGIKNIPASSDKVFNVVDRLDRHEGLHGVITSSLGKTIDHNTVSGDVQTYLAQYKQDKVAEWRGRFGLTRGKDANFWHWQEAYEGIEKDPSFATLSHEMQVAVSGELSAIAHREQPNLGVDADAAIKATDDLHHKVTSHLRDGVMAKTAVDHALPTATSHAPVTHDVAELHSISDSKAIILKKVDKGFPDLGSKAVGTVSTDLLASVDEKGNVKKFYGGTVKLSANHEDPTYNDYYKWRSLQIAQQATTDPVGAEAAVHALKNELADHKELKRGTVGTIKDKTEVNAYIAAVERKIQSTLSDPAHTQAIADTHALHAPVIQKSLEGVNAAHAAVTAQHDTLGTAIGQATQQVTKNGVVGDTTKNQAAQNAMTNLAAQHTEFVRLHSDAGSHTAEIQAQKVAVIAEMKKHADAVKDHLAKEQHDILLAHIAQLEAAQADHAAIAQAHLAAFRGSLVHNQGQAEHHLIGGNRPPVTRIPPSQ